MNIKDFAKVQELVTVKHKTELMLVKVRLNISSKTYDNAEGYSLFMSLYQGGSGSPMNFEGCCVANEVLVATESILLNKISEIEGKLVELGVDMGDE